LGNARSVPNFPFAQFSVDPVRPPILGLANGVTVYVSTFAAYSPNHQSTNGKSLFWLFILVSFYVFNVRFFGLPTFLFKTPK